MVSYGLKTVAFDFTSLLQSLQCRCVMKQRKGEWCNILAA